ncbi:MAG: XRE family transcriptional regulator [Muribaculaceae bacterium]|nr:XRE family transcriptional regulator [Muribaculaceae bacterium]MDE7111116.1 XRE family transcriptional regulator [Muribaculaceae bacterium]
MPQISIEDQKAIIQRIKKLMLLMGLSQGAFSQKLGISPANMSKHLSGRLPITVGLVNRICLDLGVSRLWLTTGEDVPFGKAESQREINIGHHREASPNRGVPIYDIDVTAGFGPLEQQLTSDRISGYIDLPGVLNPANECMVRVSGNSMEPTIPNGSYIAIREVAADTIIWGKTYVIVMEEFRMVKALRRHKNPDMVILHSLNPEYDDMEVRRDEILKLYIVDSVVNYTTA